MVAWDHNSDNYDDEDKEEEVDGIRLRWCRTHQMLVIS